MYQKRLHLLNSYPRGFCLPPWDYSTFNIPMYIKDKDVVNEVILSEFIILFPLILTVKCVGIE